MTTSIWETRGEPQSKLLLRQAEHPSGFAAEGLIDPFVPAEI
jgi:hypothetical protein